MKRRGGKANRELRGCGSERGRGRGVGEVEGREREGKGKGGSVERRRKS